MTALEFVLERWITQLCEKQKQYLLENKPVPFSYIYEHFGRKGLRKRETRKLGGYLKQKGIIKVVPCSGWKILEIPMEESGEFEND